MRFASLQSSGNGAKYAAAGKAVADSAANVFDVQRKTGPDYGSISKTAMKTAAEEKIAGMRAEASVAQAGIRAVAGIKQDQIKVDVFKNNQEIKNRQRKAGGIAAIGKIAGAGFLAATDNTKGRERPKADYSAINDAYRAKRDSLISTHESYTDGLKPAPLPKGDDAGKATSGTATSGSSQTYKPTEMGMAYMQKLTSNGMSDVQAAATVGHLMVESDNFRAMEEYSPNVHGTKGYGHLQWTDPKPGSGRRTTFERYASSNNLDPSSFEANSGYLLEELTGRQGGAWTGGGTFEGLQNTNTIQGASSYLQTNFIRPGEPHTERRLSNAQSVLDQWRNRQ